MGRSLSRPGLGKHTWAVDMDEHRGPLLNDLFGKRVLVTGGSGFIGRHVIDQLSLAECELVATYHEHKVDGVKGVEWVHLDISDELAVTTLIAELQPAYIVNLAGETGDSRKAADVERFVGVNFHGVYNLLRAVIPVSHSLERIILMGSGEEYGRVCALPITENQRTHPISPFAASKASATHFGRVYHQLFGLPIVALRPFFVYGPGQDTGMFLPSLIRSIMNERDFAISGGKQTRDFVYVADAVDAIIRAMVMPRISGEVFNISTAREQSVLDVANTCIQLSGSTIRLLVGALPYRRDELWRSCGSIDKARRMLGWQPSVDLDTGLRLTIDSYSQLAKSCAA